MAIALGPAMLGGLAVACNQVLGNQEPRLAADAMVTESSRDAGAGRDVVRMCTDGAVPSDAMHFCAARRAAGCNDFLCSDFDEGDASLDDWSPQVTDGGTLTLDETTYVSPPASLRTFVPSSKSNGLQAALATATFPGTLEGMRVHAEFDVLTCNSEVDDGGLDLSSGFLVAQVVQDFCFGVELLLVQSPAGPSLIASVVLPDTTTPSQTDSISIGSGWTHIALDTTLSMTKGSVLLNVGGNTAGLGPVATLGPGGDEYFWLGPFTFDATPRCPMLYDNFWVNLTPPP
jgi:hypothetical protein